MWLYPSHQKNVTHSRYKMALGRMDFNSWYDWDPSQGTQHLTPRLASLSSSVKPPRTTNLEEPHTWFNVCHPITFELKALNFHFALRPENCEASLAHTPQCLREHDTHKPSPNEHIIVFIRKGEEKNQSKPTWSAFLKSTHFFKKSHSQIIS